MGVGAASSPPAPRSAARSRRLRAVGSRVGPSWGLATGTITLLAAALAGYELTHGNTILAVALSLLPLALWLLTHPSLTLALLGASLPLIVSVTGSSEYSSSGYKVAASDLLLVLATAGMLLERSTRRTTPVIAALRPVRVPVLQYAGLMIVLLGVHHTFHDVVKTGQRFELFLLPLLVGAFAAYHGWHIGTLKAYVVASSLLAVVYPLDSFGLQHNPVGQFIGNAILLLIGVRALRPFLPALLLLVPGLLLTQSRGAILATGLGMFAIVAFQRAEDRSLSRRIFPLLLLAAAAFAIAPSSLRTHVTTLTPGTQSSSAYSITIREQLARDAEKIIAAHPWTGVGVGDYLTADAKVTTAPVLDPSDVILLQAAEGGYPLAISFVALIVGVLWALRRLRTIDVAPAAAGVLLATVTHGIVDVYWVRGTPLVGWLLVGMACGGYARLHPSHEPT